LGSDDFTLIDFLFICKIAILSTTIMIDRIASKKAHTAIF